MVDSRIPKPPVYDWTGPVEEKREPIMGARAVIQPLTYPGTVPIGLTKIERLTSDGLIMTEHVVGLVTLSCGCLLGNPAELAQCGICEYVDQHGVACGRILHASQRMPPCSATVHCCGRRVCRSHLRADAAGNFWCADHDTAWKRFWNL